MKGFLIVRKEKHIDDRHWVFTDEDLAMRVAEKVTDYLVDQYEPDEDELDISIPDDSDDLLFYASLEDAFSVFVEEIEIKGRDDEKDFL